MSRVCVRKGRFGVCTVVLWAGFLLLAGRLVYLQAIEAERIAAAAEPVRERLVELASKRGDILDRRGALLAGTRSMIRLGVDPHSYGGGSPEGLARLAAILEMPLEELEEKASRRYRINGNGERRAVRWVPLAEIDEGLYEVVGKLQVPGVYGNRHYERTYPGEALGAHVVGYVNREGTPVMGVEQALDFYLRGQAGWRETEVDGRQHELAAFRHREVAPRDGLDVRLTLDLYVQAAVERELGRLVEEMRPEAATVIVSRPGSGEILGMANWPTFDPNVFHEFPLANQRNRAVSDQYEPGSTFKVVTIGAALEEGLVEMGSLLDCSVLAREYDGVRVPLPEDAHPMGEVPVRKVLVKSSNRGAAQIGMLLGEERLYEHARAFGFGQAPRWPLAGEAGGRLHEVKEWDNYMISRVPTGYGVAVTPLQIHLAMAAIANGGVMVQPRILQQVGGKKAESLLPLGRRRAKRVLSERTVNELWPVMMEVASAEGTAQRAAIEGYAVAGKTGTTRKLVNGRYDARRHIGSFSGFFPAPDPQVVITVVVDEGKPESGPGYGGVVAAPVFRRIGEALIPHLSIRKPESIEPFVVQND